MEGVVCDQRGEKRQEGGGGKEKLHKRDRKIKGTSTSETRSAFLLSESFAKIIWSTYGLLPFAFLRPCCFYPGSPRESNGARFPRLDSVRHKILARPFCQQPACLSSAAEASLQPFDRARKRVVLQQRLAGLLADFLLLVLRVGRLVSETVALEERTRGSSTSMSSTEQRA